MAAQGASYGVDLFDPYRKAASYVERIFAWAQIRVVPQPTKFELVINLKAAAVLNLTVPQSLLIQADQTIE